jgi:serine/threonine protein kinase
MTVFVPPTLYFSLGLILLEMAANIILPENGQGWQMLRAGDFSNCHELSNVSSELQQLIAQMLHPNTEERYTVEQVLEHPKMKEIHMVEQDARVGVLYQHIQRLETMAAVALGKRAHLVSQDDSAFCTPVDERDTWDDTDDDAK